MQIGFSVVGVVFLLMLFVPNMRWARNQPQGYEEISAHENKALLVFERVGEVACSCAAVAFVCPSGFALLGVWYESPVAVMAALVLGVGHIGIHVGHLRELSGR